LLFLYFFLAFLFAVLFFLGSFLWIDSVDWSWSILRTCSRPMARAMKVWWLRCAIWSITSNWLAEYNFCTIPIPKLLLLSILLVFSSASTGILRELYLEVTLWLFRSAVVSRVTLPKRIDHPLLRAS
jgi:hypothetical protein